MRILIVKLYSLGDVAQSLPALQDLRRAHPDAVIDWMVEPRFAGVLRRVHGIGEVIAIPLARWRDAWWKGQTRSEYRELRRKLADRRYDAVIDLQGLVASAIAARLVPLAPGGRRHGIGNHVEGYEHEFAARWLLDNAVRVGPRMHAVDLAREVCAAALGHAVEGPARYGLERHRTPPADSAKPTVAFVHGASNEAALWPDAHWITLGKRMLDAGWRVALPQRGEAEQTRAELIAAALQFERAPLVEVWPSLKLEAALDRLASVQGVIGVDAGLARLALGLGLPQVQIHQQPTVWRNGPLPSHGRDRQVALEGKPAPDAVWSAWRRVAGSPR